jgi:hypothetical protein
VAIFVWAVTTRAACHAGVRSSIAAPLKIPQHGHQLRDGLEDCAVIVPDINPGTSPTITIVLDAQHIAIFGLRI